MQDFRGVPLTPPKLPGVPPDYSQTSRGHSRPLPELRGALQTPTDTYRTSGGLPTHHGLLRRPTDPSRTSGGPSRPLPTHSRLLRALPNPPDPSRISEGRPNPSRTSSRPTQPLPYFGDPFDPSRTFGVPPDPSRTFERSSRHLPDFRVTLPTIPGLLWGLPDPSRPVLDFRGALSAP